ncbi:unnamed protein product, partial [Vitis vinifera]
MKPSPSVSISDIMRVSSSGDVVEPSAWSTSPNSSAEILPSPFLSNLLNTLSTSSMVPREPHEFFAIA